jgi:2-C-methyl-D-erythritol 4-phosphate cytidylyltransferase
MGAECPKQYLPLLGKPLIYHTLAALCAVPAIERVFVVLSAGDAQWARHNWEKFGSRVQPLFCGGATRADSVLGGLNAIADKVSATDWILVHDAARPCVAVEHIEKLIRNLEHDDVGGLLAIPLSDTLKRADSSCRATSTLSRENLWCAQTPQMFRYLTLRRALEATRNVTDEASAIEAAGGHPKLVESDSANFKVTRPVDILFAEWILRSREATQGERTP